MIITDSTGKEYNIKGKFKIDISEDEYMPRKITLRTNTGQLGVIIDNFLTNEVDFGTIVEDKNSE